MASVIAIVGLSYAGLAGYSQLRRSLPSKESHTILLIDKKEYFEWTPSILSTFFALNTHKNLSIPYSQILQNKFIQGKLIKLTRNSLMVLKKDLSQEEFLFDYCVLSFGGSYPFYIRPEQEITLNERFQSLIQVSSQIKEAQNILILGSGPTALEMAGFLRNKAKKSNIILSVHGKEILKGFPPKAGKKVFEILKKKGVSFIFDSKISLENLELTNPQIKYDLVIPCVGNQTHASKVLNNMETFRDFIDPVRDRLIVNEFRQLRAKNGDIIDNVFACGDISISYENFIKNECDPDVVMRAELSAHVAAENIARMINKKKQGKNSVELRKMGKPMDAYVIDLGSKSDCVFVFKRIVIAGILAWTIKQILEKAGMRKILGYRLCIWLFVLMHFMARVLNIIGL